MMAAKSRKQQIQEMLADDPNDPFLRYGLAMELVSEGATEEAVRCFRELLGATPDYIPAYLQAGQALVRLGRTEEARTLFQEGIAAAQKKGDLHARDEMQGFLASLEEG
jgi:tetratricopeptide (TPR) repeat protein